MTSIRHTPGIRTDEDALLDAARDCVLAVGLRRTTLTDVARRAGVSRMTMYRRWPDMATLVADLMTREWGELALQAQATATGRHTRERLVDGLANGVRRLREHPVFRRIVELDPEVLLPYLVDRRGTSQDRMLAALLATIAEGHADGSVRSGAPEPLAASLLLTLHGFVISAGTMTDQVTTAGLDSELRLLLDRYLAP
ncbi:TetR/AcrR family transcriptional regulator [Actinoplanes sp. NEAU-A12]|uniref:TetR/AcrR family transcriptional regulator n=1 Tax=Actinoplanes sandaracinus TaxID=3045177 RepID=A0ABT6WTL5_9ACTN|nr:TetR/AcrR family transcriptional regulator [Actinoplanes sandaracinus]MDI6103039.1 TetR/AcrR family transcriptional regulator [Actinoplanes sandaracinus]